MRPTRERESVSEAASVEPVLLDTSVLLDATLLLRAVGDPGEERDLSRDYLRGLAAGRARAYASVTVIGELVTERVASSGQRGRAVREAREIAAAVTLVPLDPDIVDTALALIAASVALPVSDAVHAATALVRGIPTLASTNAAFDGVPGIRRIDPLAHRG